MTVSQPSFGSVEKSETAQLHERVYGVYGYDIISFLDLSEPSDAVWEGVESASRWALTFIPRFRTLLTGPARLLAANGHSFSTEWQKKRLKREKWKKSLLMGWKREETFYMLCESLPRMTFRHFFFLDWIWNGDTLELLIRGCWLKKKNWVW